MGIVENREKSRLRQNQLRQDNPQEYYKKVAIRVALWRKRNPEKIEAHRKVFVAVRNGTLKSVKCFCGKIKTEAHHKDYSKPLEVVWYCKKHHRLADRNELDLSTSVETRSP